MADAGRETTRTRYRFVTRIETEAVEGGIYVWQAVQPSDSRVEEIRCPASWFWSPPVGREVSWDWGVSWDCGNDAYLHTCTDECSPDDTLDDADLGADAGLPAPSE